MIEVRQFDTEVIYEQTSGNIYISDMDDARALIGRGYSGAADCVNNSQFEAVAEHGPIPRGKWRLDAPIKHERLGPLAFRLWPIDHNAFGRTAFFIHGDNARGDFSASSGCIIAGRATREAIRALGCRRLLVIP